MGNLLPDLQDEIFSMIRILTNKELKGDALDKEIKKAMAFNEMARTAIANGALMIKAADVLYGLPVSEKLPLIPPSPAEDPKIFDGKRKNLLDMPKVGRTVNV